MLADDFRTATRSAIAGLGLAVSPLAAWLEEQVVWTAAHESGGFRYRRQVHGPARGLCQQEPARVEDLFDNFIRYHEDLAGALDQLQSECGVEGLDVGPALERSDEYAAAICVLEYLRHAPAVLASFPLAAGGAAPATDPDTLAAIWKRFYNTPAGAGTVAEFVADGNRYVKGDVA